jgi:hypothetical protein
VNWKSPKDNKASFYFHHWLIVGTYEHNYMDCKVYNIVIDLFSLLTLHEDCGNSMVLLILLYKCICCVAVY